MTASGISRFLCAFCTPVFFTGASRSPLPGSPALAFPCRGTIYRALSVAPSPPLSSRPMQCGGSRSQRSTETPACARLLSPTNSALPAAGRFGEATYRCQIAPFLGFFTASSSRCGEIQRWYPSIDARRQEGRPKRSPGHPPVFTPLRWCHFVYPSRRFPGRMWPSIVT